MVAETSTTTGTGTLTLLGATFGMRKLDEVFSSGDEVFYLIEEFDDEDDPTSGGWELGKGTFTSPDQLARADADIKFSSNSNNRVDWGAGTRQVKIVHQIDDIGGSDPYMEGANDLSEVVTDATARTNLGLGAASVATEGSGNGLDADKVDGVEAAAILQLAGTQTVTGGKTFSGANTFSGVGTWEGENDYSASGGRFIAPVGASLWAT